jgi:hypothetical protein
MKKIIPSLALALFLAACQSSAPLEDISADDPPQALQESDADASTKAYGATPQHFRFNGQKSQKIRTPYGTLIEIPANAFVRKKDQSPVQGEVELIFEEYHTKGEIMASGISMVYKNPKGEKEQFESAGMFSIRAVQGQEELALASGKTLKVDVPSEVGGAFNFYQLTDDGSNWDLKDTDCPVKENPAIQEKADKIEQLTEELPDKPRKPLVYKDGDKLFDIQMLTHYSGDLNELTGMMWKYTGDDPKKDPAKLQEKQKEPFTAIDIIPLEGQIQEYYLVLESGHTWRDTVRAAPVYKGKLLDRENKRIAKMLNKINADLNAIQDLKRQLENEKKFLRSMQIDELAIYNYDRQFKDPNAVPMFAEIRCNGKLVDDFKNWTVFLLPGQKRVVIRYDEASLDAFALNPRESNTLMALLPDGSAYMLSPREIREMNLGPAQQGKKVVFELKEKEKVKSPAAIDNLLAER